MIAIDSVTLANLAQQLDARCDPQHIAAEIRVIVANAKLSVEPEVAHRLYRALKTNGSHTCGVHKPRACPMCSAIAEYEQKVGTT